MPCSEYITKMFFKHKRDLCDGEVTVVDFRLYL